MKSQHNVEIEYQNNKFYIQLWDVSSTLEDQITDFFRNTSLFVLMFDYSNNTKAPLLVVTHDSELMERFDRTIDVRDFQ